MTYPTSPLWDWKHPPESAAGNDVRLDVELTRRGLARSRAQAQTLIKSGYVLVNASSATQSSRLVTATDHISVTGAEHGYVSRGGVKLAAALDAFSISPQGLCLDAGASTGGFTDCLLQHGAACVVAVDVGHGQMDSRLANDARVEHREGVNVRFLTPRDFAAPFDLIVVDLSFISLGLVLPALDSLLSAHGKIIALVKPQFEVGPARLGKGGIVKDPNARRDALCGVQEAARAIGLLPGPWIDSPITGADGNREYLALFSARGEPSL